MTRGFAVAFAGLLHRHAASEKYPTRTVEYVLAGLIIVWSYSCLLPAPVMAGPVYAPMVSFLPELWWGLIGIVLGLMRVAALIGNGHWAPAPGLRIIGAVTGAMFWLALFGLYTQAVMMGATDFPMRRCYVVLILGEFYSCFRCGQDFIAMRVKRAGEKARRAGASGSTDGTGHV